MKIELVCFSSLAETGKCDFRNAEAVELSEGQTVKDLIDHVGIAQNDVKIAFVNSRIADFNGVLTHGDRVGLAPAVGGM